MHTLGFWHEQSRPDRDSYVRIVTENISTNRVNAFKKRKADQVNSLGVPYDYDSIMHYGLNYFVNRTKCGTPQCHTLEVINDDVYEAQGRPKLGTPGGLSPKDIQQLLLLYKCPAPNVGTLKVLIRYTRNLTNTDSHVNNPSRKIADPYVRVIALEKKYQKDTTTKFETLNPEWNEWIDLGDHGWQSCLRLQIFDFDGVLGAEKLSDLQSSPIRPGRQSWLQINGYKGTLTFDVLCA